MNTWTDFNLLLCTFPNCNNLATTLAAGRDINHPAYVKKYCKKHADIVADDGSSEYTVHCSNCKCLFGV